VTRVLTALLFLSGCNDCKQDDTRCNGKIPEVCAWGDTNLRWEPRSWSMEQCPVACAKLASKGATCVDSPQPIAECANQIAACWNGKLTTCVEGYPTQTTPCNAGTCFASSECAGGALCLSSTSADARCPNPTDYGGFCDGDAAVQCWCGRIRTQIACNAGKCLQQSGMVACAQ
jgi:hypothetical protein